MQCSSHPGDSSRLLLPLGLLSSSTSLAQLSSFSQTSISSQRADHACTLSLDFNTLLTISNVRHTDFPNSSPQTLRLCANRQFCLNAFRSPCSLPLWGTTPWRTDSPVERGMGMRMLEKHLVVRRGQTAFALAKPETQATASLAPKCRV